MSDSSEPMEDRVRRVMAERGLTWSQAWAALHDELTPAEVEVLTLAGANRPIRPRVPGIAFAAMACGAGWIVGLLSIAIMFEAVTEVSAVSVAVVIFWFWVLVAVWTAAPIVLGVMAIRRISRSDGELTGVWVAWIGILFTAAWVILFAYVVMNSLYL